MNNFKKKVTFHSLFFIVMMAISFKVGTSSQQFVYDTRLQNYERLEKVEEEYFQYRKRVMESGLRFISAFDGSFIDSRVKSSVVFAVADQYDVYNSQATRKFMADKIVEYSEKYDLDPMLVLSLLYSESSLNAEIRQQHPDVVGMAGINYKVWGDILTKEGIIYSKKDLKNIEVAIHSLCFVVDAMRRNKSDSAFQSIWSYKGRGYDKTLGKTGKSVATGSFEIYKEMKVKASQYLIAMK
jgi:hypothetical protein